MVESAIVAEKLTKKFGDVLAVDNLSFQVGRGKITGFLGPNGAGKSTTLRMLLGLVRPTSGSATIAGIPYTKLRTPARYVGAVLETSSFHPGRSAMEHMRWIAAAGGLSSQRIGQTLKLVGLQGVADRRVGKFSLGMRQRLGLAAALLGNPAILILDEPANGLDPEGIHWLRNLLRYLANQGRSILISSHVLAEIAQIADEVIIIAGGRLVAQAGVGELTASHEHSTRVVTPQLDQLTAVLAAKGVPTVSLGNGHLIARGISPRELGELASASGIVLHELVAQQTNLEEVFLELTGSEGSTMQSSPTTPGAERTS